VINGAEPSVDPRGVPGAGLKTCTTFVMPTRHAGQVRDLTPTLGMVESGMAVNKWWGVGGQMWGRIDDQAQGVFALT